MSMIATWNGIIARFGVPTTDGRGLELAQNELLHFTRIPAPVTAREPGGGMQAVGAVTHVRVETPPQLHRAGKDLWAEGFVDLEKLFPLRPDLRDEYERPKYIEGNTVPVPQYWPVGITVIDGDFVETADIRTGNPLLSIQGPWQLTGLAIEEESSVWPGVGIQLIKIELSQS